MIKNWLGQTLMVGDIVGFFKVSSIVPRVSVGRIVSFTELDGCVIKEILEPVPENLREPGRVPWKRIEKYDKTVAVQPDRLIRLDPKTFGYGVLES